MSVSAPLLRLFGQHRQGATLALCLLLGAAASFYLLGNLLGAWFHSADDHNIVQRITAGRPSLAGWWDLWLQSEVSSFGMSERYRPTLWAVQALEVIAFGADAGAMYAVRLVFFAVFLGAVLFTLQQATNWFVAAALTVYIANLSIWGDVFARSLVIPEAHAAGFFGVALIAIALAIKRLNGEGPVNRAMIAASVGMALAAGSKENFIFLAAPVLGLIVYAILRRRLSWWAAGICLLTFATPAAVAWTIYNYVAAQGTDFYGRDASPLARLAILNDWLPPTIPFVIAAVAALIGAFLAARALPQHAGQLRKRVLWTSALALIAGAWWCWEIVFYNGDILAENNQRYGFPAVLITPFCIAAALHLALSFGAALGGRAARIGMFAASLTAAGAILGWARPIEFSVREAAAAKAASTAIFHNEVRTAAALFNQHPDWPIIAEKVGWDAPELPLSARVWLRVEGVGNPLFLRMHPEADADSRGAFEEELYQTLQRASAGGTHGLTPFDQFDPSAEQTRECYSLSWEGSFPSACPQAVLRVPERPMEWRDGALVAAE